MYLCHSSSEGRPQGQSTAKNERERKLEMSKRLTYYKLIFDMQMDRERHDTVVYAYVYMTLATNVENVQWEMAILPQHLIAFEVQMVHYTCTIHVHMPHPATTVKQ